MAVDPKAYEQPTVADEENAALLWEKAAREIDVAARSVPRTRPLHYYMPDLLRTGDARDREIIAGLLANEYASALRVAHEAADRSAVDWGVRYPPMAMGFVAPHLSYVRDVRELLDAATALAVVQNDRAAIEKHLATTCELLDDLLQSAGGDVLVRTYERHVDASARFVQGLFPQLNREDLPREAFARLRDWLLDTAALRARFLRGSAEELAINLASLDAVASAEPWPRALYTTFAIREQQCLGIDMWLASRRILELEAYRPHIEIITALELPTDVNPYLSEHVGLLSFARAVRDSQRGFLSQRMETTVLHELLATALALHLYRADEGAFPATLDALVPTYLPAVLRDPFGEPGDAILYLPAPADGFPRVYSVGPSGWLRGDGVHELPEVGGSVRDDVIRVFLDGVPGD